jgi:hypothetical protein
MDERALFWIFPALGVAAIAFQLRSGRIAFGLPPGKWRVVEKEQEEGRFWLCIIAEGLLVLILIGQALA